MAGDGDLEAALDLWRGPALAGAAYRLRGHPAVVRLARMRLGLTLRYAESTPEHAAARLRALTADEPLHETLHARLMLALAASGDRACALQLYADFHKRLVEELGVEPSDEVQRVHLSLGAVFADDRVRPGLRPAR